MTDLMATHSCFDDAIDFFEQVVDVERLVTQPDDVNSFRVVHGVCTAAQSGHRYAHAWVEQRRGAVVDGGREVDLVWQAATRNGARVYFAIEREAFYQAFGVERSTRYSLRQAAQLNRDTGHYGPWRRDYAELCRRTGDGRILGIAEGPSPLAVIPVEVRVES